MNILSVSIVAGTGMLNLATAVHNMDAVQGICTRYQQLLQAIFMIFRVGIHAYHILIYVALLLVHLGNVLVECCGTYMFVSD